MVATYLFWVAQARNITILSRDVSNLSVLGRAKSHIISWVAQSRNITVLSRNGSNIPDLGRNGRNIHIFSRNGRNRTPFPL